MLEKLSSFPDAGPPVNEALSGDDGDAADAEADPVAAMAGGGNGGSIIAGFVLFTVLVCAAYYVVKWKRSGDGDRRRPGGCEVHHIQAGLRLQ